jgi:hypothetical protein
MRGNMDNDKLALDILDQYGDTALSAELVVYHIRNGQVVRDTIIVDFSGDDYQYQKNVKPIYTE